jgi:GNAT superfamily N-acetyltransferase
MTDLAIHALTPDRWDDFVDLMGTDSVTRLCWCMLNRMPSSVRKETTPESRKAAMRKLVKAGPPPGLLAYRGNAAVAWIAVAPRAATPDWNMGRKASAVENEADAGNPAVWAATCFFVRAGHRKQGLAGDLLDAGLAHAKGHGAARLEACPMSHDDKRSTVGLCVGPKRVFERAGFETVIERKPGRPLMRLDLTKKKKAATAKTPAGKAKR